MNLIIPMAVLNYYVALAAFGVSMVSRDKHVRRKGLMVQLVCAVFGLVLGALYFLTR